MRLNDYALRRFIAFVSFTSVVNGAWAAVDSDSTLRGDTIRTVNIMSHLVRREQKSGTPLYSLSRQDFARLGVVDMVDALHRLPGITLRDYGGAGGMKTVSVRGFGSQHTGVSYDGLMLGDCQTGQIDLQRYGLSNMQSISLNVGDGDSIFLPARGIASVAAVSLESASLYESKAELTMGSWEMVNPFVNIAADLGRGMKVGFTAEYTHAENNYPYTIKNVKETVEAERNNSRMNQFHGELNFLWQASATSQLSAKAYYYDSDRELPGAVQLYVNESDETLHEKNAFGQLRYKWNLSQKFSFMANAKYNWSMSDYHNGIPSGGITSADYYQREGYGSASLLYMPLPAFSLNYSGDYWFNSLNGLNGSKETDASNNPLRHNMLHSLSAKWQVGKLKIIGRGLWTKVWERGLTKNSQFSPSVSMSLRPLERHDFYIRASYKHIFRMPSFNELYYFHFGSTDLSPETTNQLNFGVTEMVQGPGFRIQGSVDGYVGNVDDKIVSVPVNMFVWRTVNMAKVRTYGMDVNIDIDVDINHNHKLLLAGNYSLQRVLNHTNSESKYYDTQIAYTPLHSGSITMAWQNPWCNLSLTGDGMSKRWSTNEHNDDTDLSGFMEWGATVYKDLRLSEILNLRSSEKPGNPEIRVKLSVLNIFDHQYEIVSRYPMPGRSWRLSISYRF